MTALLLTYRLYSPLLITLIPKSPWRSVLLSYLVQLVFVKRNCICWISLKEEKLKGVSGLTYAVIADWKGGLLRKQLILENHQALFGNWQQILMSLIYVIITIISIALLCNIISCWFHNIFLKCSKYSLHTKVFVSTLLQVRLLSTSALCDLNYFKTLMPLKYGFTDIWK